MGNGANLAKVLALIGIIILLTASITGSTPPAWTAIRNTIQAGISMPAFWNPFTEEIVHESAFVEAPTNLTGFSEQSVSGCENTSFGRAECLGTPDGDTSYIRMAVYSEMFFGNSTFLLTHNWTNPGFLLINGPQLRKVQVTIMCLTETGGNTSTAKLLFDWNTYGNPVPSAIRGDCKRGEEYSTIILTDTFESGLPDCDAACFPFTLTDHIYQADIVSLPPSFGVLGNPIVRISYIRIDVEFSRSSNCEPPEGAWFPALDQVACAIIGFGNFVWRGIQLVGSAIAFLILTLATVVLFVGSIIVNLLLGTVSVFGTLFNLGAPSPIQEMIDVLVIVSGGFLIFTVVSLVRGTEG